MKNCNCLIVLLAVLFSLPSFSQSTNSKGIEKFEMSIQIGAGFSWGNKAPVEGVLREPDFAWASGVSGFPAFEAYGAV